MLLKTRINLKLVGTVMLGGRSVILVVDDEERIRNIIGEQLLEDGYEVLLATDGDKAWEALQGDIVIDLILTDVRMPGSINGIDLIEKALANRPSLRSIIMSGYTNEAAKRVKVADTFIQKPFSLISLSRSISQILSR